MNVKKAISLLTVTCFLVSFILRDAVSAVIEMTRVPGSVAQALDTLVLPAGVGRITDSGYSGTDKVVITLQDLHCHPEVQRNIARILTLLQEKYHFTKIYVEGASGVVNTGWLTGIRDRELKKTLVESLVNRGRLTGEEYYSVLSDRPTVQYGIENEALHRENIVRLGKILERQPYYETVLEGMRRELAVVQRARFSRQNRRFNDYVERYRHEEIDTERYYTLLVKYAKKIEADPDRFGPVGTITAENYRTIIAYLELLATGRRLNSRKVSVQLQRFIGDLKTVLPYAAYARLLKKTGQFSRQEELCLYLSRIAKDRKMDIGVRYPELGRYFEYREKMEGVNPVRLLAEEKRLTESVRIGLSEDMGELEVGFLSEFLGCYEDYLKNRLLVEDYEYFTGRFPRFEALWRKYIPGNDLGRLSGDHALLNEYYRVNVARNDCFIDTILGPGVAREGNAAPEAGKESAASVLASLDKGSEAIVVVTGGFHTGGLVKLLKERGVSYLTITPNVTTDATVSTEVYETLARHQARILANALRLAPLSAENSPEQVAALVEAIEPLFNGKFTRVSVDGAMKKLVEVWDTNGELKEALEKAGTKKENIGDIAYEYRGEVNGKHHFVIRFEKTGRELAFTLDPDAEKEHRVGLTVEDAEKAAKEIKETAAPAKKGQRKQEKERMHVAAVALGRVARTSAYSAEKEAALVEELEPLFRNDFGKRSVDRVMSKLVEDWNTSEEFKRERAETGNITYEHERLNRKERRRYFVIRFEKTGKELRFVLDTGDTGDQGRLSVTLKNASYIADAENPASETEKKIQATGSSADVTEKTVPNPGKESLHERKRRIAEAGRELKEASIKSGNVYSLTDIVTVMLKIGELRDENDKPVPDPAFQEFLAGRMEFRDFLDSHLRDMPADSRKQQLTEYARGQSPFPLQYIVEAIVNGQDAVLKRAEEERRRKKGIPVGQIGAGAYQTFKPLLTDKNAVFVLESSKGSDAYRDSASRFVVWHEGGDDFKIAFDRFPGVTKAQGTAIVIDAAMDTEAGNRYAEDSLGANAQGLIINAEGRVINHPEKYVHGNRPPGTRMHNPSESEISPTRFGIWKDGMLVLDDGTGMDTGSVLTLFLTPKDTKKDVEPQETEADTLYRHDAEKDDGRALIRAYTKGDAPVHRLDQFVVEPGDGRFHLANEMVIAFPRGTDITEDRSELKLDPVAIRAIEKLIDKLTDLPPGVADPDERYRSIPDREMQLNTLLQMLRQMEGKDKRKGNSAAAHLMRYAAEKAGKPGGLIDYYKDNAIVVLPNKTAWRRVAPLGKKVVYLDEELYRLPDLLSGDVFSELSGNSSLAERLPDAAKIYTVAFSLDIADGAVKAAVSPVIVETVGTEQYVFVNKDAYDGAGEDLEILVNRIRLDLSRAPRSASAARRRSNNKAKEAVLRAAALRMMREAPDSIEQNMLKAIKAQDMDRVKEIAGQLKMRTERDSFLRLGKISLADELKGAAGLSDSGILHILNSYQYYDILHSYYEEAPQLKSNETLLEQQMIDSLVGQGYDEKAARMLLDDGIDWRLVQSKYDRLNFALYTTELFGETITRFNIGRVIMELRQLAREGALLKGTTGFITKLVVVPASISFTVVFLFVRYFLSVYHYYYFGMHNYVYPTRDSIFRLTMDEITAQENRTVNVRIPLANVTFRLFDPQRGSYLDSWWDEAYLSLRRTHDTIRMAAEKSFVLALARYLQSRAKMYFWVTIVAGSLLGVMLEDPWLLFPPMTLLFMKMKLWGSASAKEYQTAEVGVFMVIWLLTDVLLATLSSLVSTAGGMATLGVVPLAVMVVVRLGIVAILISFSRFNGEQRQHLFDARLFKDELELPSQEGEPGVRGFHRVDTKRFMPWSFKGDTLTAYLESLAARWDDPAMKASERSALEGNMNVIREVLYHDEQPLVRHRISDAGENQKKQIRNLLAKLLPNAPPIQEQRIRELRHEVFDLNALAGGETLFNREYWKAVAGIFVGMIFFGIEYLIFIFGLNSIDITLSSAFHKEIHVFKQFSMLFTGARESPAPNSGVLLYSYDSWLGRFVIERGGMGGLFNSLVEDAAIRFPGLNALMTPKNTHDIMQGQNRSFSDTVTMLSEFKLAMRENRIEQLETEIRQTPAWTENGSTAFAGPDGTAGNVSAESVQQPVEGNESVPYSAGVPNPGNDTVLLDNDNLDLSDTAVPHTPLGTASGNTSSPLIKGIEVNLAGKAEPHILTTIPAGGKVVDSESIDVVVQGDGDTTQVHLYERILDGRIRDVQVTNEAGENLPFERSGDRGEILKFDYNGQVVIKENIDIYDRQLVLSVEGEVPYVRYHDMPDEWKERLLAVMDKSDGEKIRAVNDIMAEYFVYDYDNYLKTYHLAEQDNGEKNWMAAADSFVGRQERIPVICTSASAFYVELLRYAGFDPEDAFVASLETDGNGTLYSDDVDHVMPVVDIDGQRQFVESLADVPVASDSPALLDTSVGLEAMSSEVVRPMVSEPQSSSEATHASEEPSVGETNALQIHTPAQSESADPSQPPMENNTREENLSSTEPTAPVENESVSVAENPVKPTTVLLEGEALKRIVTVLAAGMIALVGLAAGMVSVRKKKAARSEEEKNFGKYTQPLRQAGSDVLVMRRKAAEAAPRLSSIALRIAAGRKRERRGDKKAERDTVFQATLPWGRVVLGGNLAYDIWRQAALEYDKKAGAGLYIERNDGAWRVHPFTSGKARIEYVSHEVVGDTLYILGSVKRFGGSRRGVVLQVDEQGETVLAGGEKDVRIDVSGNESNPYISFVAGKELHILHEDTPGEFQTRTVTIPAGNEYRVMRHNGKLYVASGRAGKGIEVFDEQGTEVFRTMNAGVWDAVVGHDFGRTELGGGFLTALDGLADMRRSDREKIVGFRKIGPGYFAILSSGEEIMLAGKTFAGREGYRYLGTTESGMMLLQNAESGELRVVDGKGRDVSGAFTLQRGDAKGRRSFEGYQEYLPVSPVSHNSGFYHLAIVEHGNGKMYLALFAAKNGILTIEDGFTARTGSPVSEAIAGITQLDAGLFREWDQAVRSYYDNPDAPEVENLEDDSPFAGGASPFIYPDLAGDEIEENLKRMEQDARYIGKLDESSQLAAGLLPARVRHWSLAYAFMPDLLPVTVSYEAADRLGDFVKNYIDAEGSPDQQELRALLLPVAGIYRRGIPDADQVVARYLKVVGNYTGDKKDRNGADEFVQGLRDTLLKSWDAGGTYRTGIEMLAPGNSAGWKDPKDLQQLRRSEWNKLQNLQQFYLTYLTEGFDQLLKHEGEGDALETLLAELKGKDGDSLAKLVRAAKEVELGEDDDDAFTRVTDHYEKLKGKSYFSKDMIGAVNNQGGVIPVWIRELVQNARDAVRGGALRQHVRIRSYINGSRWIVSVRDDGGMMLRIILKVLLDPDATTKSSAAEVQEVIRSFEGSPDDHDGIAVALLETLFVEKVLQDTGRYRKVRARLVEILDTDRDGAAQRIADEFGSENEDLLEKIYAGAKGQGFFTVFKGADEVMVRSGGGGKVYEVRLKPVHRKNRVVDVKFISMKEYRDTGHTFKGTEVQRIKYIDEESFPEEKAQMENGLLYYYAAKLIGAISDVDVSWNEKSILDTMEKVTDSVRVSMAGFTRLNVDELFIQDPGALMYVPYEIKTLLLAHAVNYDNDRRTRVVRTRNAVIDPGRFKRKVARATLEATAVLWRKGKIELPGMPSFDEYMRRFPWNDTKAELRTLEDAKKIHAIDAGETVFADEKEEDKFWEEYGDRYAGNVHQWVELMLSIPSGPDGRSIREMKEDRYFGSVPDELRTAFTEYQKMSMGFDEWWTKPEENAGDALHKGLYVHLRMYALLAAAGLLTVKTERVSDKNNDALRIADRLNRNEMEALDEVTGSNWKEVALALELPEIGKSAGTVVSASSEEKAARPGRDGYSVTEENDTEKVRAVIRAVSENNEALSALREIFEEFLGRLGREFGEGTGISFLRFSSRDMKLRNSFASFIGGGGVVPLVEEFMKNLSTNNDRIRYSKSLYDEWLKSNIDAQQLRDALLEKHSLEDMQAALNGLESDSAFLNRNIVIPVNGLSGQEFSPLHSFMSQGKAGRKVTVDPWMIAIATIFEHTTGVVTRLLYSALGRTGKMLYTTRLLIARSAEVLKPERSIPRVSIDLVNVSNETLRQDVKAALFQQLGTEWKKIVDETTVMRIAGELKQKGAAEIEFIADSSLSSDTFADTKGGKVRFQGWLAARSADRGFNEFRGKLVDLLVVREGLKLRSVGRWIAPLRPVLYVAKLLADERQSRKIIGEGIGNIVHPRRVAERIAEKSRLVDSVQGSVANVRNSFGYVQQHAVQTPDENIPAETRYAAAAERIGTDDGTFDRAIMHLAVTPDARKTALGNARYGNDEGVNNVVIFAGKPEGNAEELFNIPGQGSVYAKVEKGVLVLYADGDRADFPSMVEEIARAVNGFGKFKGDAGVVGRIRGLYTGYRIFGDLKFDRLSFAPGMIVDYDGAGELTTMGKGAAVRMLFGEAVFVGMKKKDGELEKAAGKRYDFVVEPGDAGILFDIYLRESALRKQAESVMRGRAVIAEEIILEEKLKKGAGAYAEELAEQNENAAGILLKSRKGIYDSLSGKLVAALHEKKRKVYGSFSAVNNGDIKKIAKQIDTREKDGEMRGRFDGAVVDMGSAVVGDVHGLLKMLRESVRSSALLVVIPPAGIPEDVRDYAQDNGIYLNADVTQTTLEGIARETQGYDSGHLGSNLNLGGKDWNKIDEFFERVLPQVSLKLLIVNAGELRTQLPRGMLDNALLKTAYLFRMLSVREKTVDEIAAEQKELAFAIKERQLESEMFRLNRYLEIIKEARKAGEVQGTIAVPDEWMTDSLIVHQMKKLEGNRKAQRIFLEAAVARLLLMNEKEKDEKFGKRFKDGFDDPGLESILAEALLERELQEGKQTREGHAAGITLPDDVAAAVAVDNYLRERYRAMKAGKADPETIEELIAVIKTYADPKKWELEPVKEMNRAAYDALLSAA